MKWAELGSPNPAHFIFCTALSSPRTHPCLHMCSSKNDLLPQNWVHYHRTQRTNPNPSPTGTIGERQGSDLSQNGGRLSSKCELLKLAICKAFPISAVVVQVLPALFTNCIEFGAVNCATGVAHLLCCEMSVSLLLSWAASSSVSVTVFEPSFQLKVMTILSSYRKTALIKMSTRLLRYAGSSMSP